MTNQELIQGFQNSLVSERKDPKTISVYTSAVKFFVEAIGKDVQEITILDIDTFLQKLHTMELKENTINQKYLIGARQFIDYLIAYGYNKNFKDEAKAMLVRKLKNVKFDDRKIDHHESVDTKSFGELLKYASKMTENTRITLRKKVMAMLFLTTGMRKEELITLCLSDFNFNNNTVTPNKQKFGKVRTIGLLPEVAKLCSALFEMNGCDYLFITDTGKQMTPRGASQTMHGFISHARRAGIDINNLTPHGIRRSFASYLYYEKQIPLSTIAQILGHSDVRTTQIYIDRKNVDSITMLQDKNLFNL